MPILRNPRHEAFAQELAKGTSARQAYERAGYRGGHNSARLSHDEAILRRVEELLGRREDIHTKATQKAAERAEITVESLLREIEEVRALAVADGQFAAAVAATKEKAILAGKRIERQERGEPGEFKWLEGMNADELRALIRERTEAGSVCIDDPAEEDGVGGSGGQLN